MLWRLPESKLFCYGKECAIVPPGQAKRTASSVSGYYLKRPRQRRSCWKSSGGDALAQRPRTDVPRVFARRVRRPQRHMAESRQGERGEWVPVGRERACMTRQAPAPPHTPVAAALRVSCGRRNPAACASAGEWLREAEGKASGREAWRCGREGGEEGVGGGGGGIRRGPGRQVHKLLTTAAAAMMPPHRRRKMATRAATSPTTLYLAADSRVFVTTGKFVKNAVVWRSRRRLRRHGGRAFDHQRNRLRRPGGRDGGSCGECLRLFDLSSPSDLSPALSPCLSFSLLRTRWPSRPPPPRHRMRGRRGGLGTKDVQGSGAILQRDGRSTERVGEKRGPHTAAREQRYNDARSLPPRQCVPPRRPVISLALPPFTDALSSCPGHFLIPRTLRHSFLPLRYFLASHFPATVVSPRYSVISLPRCWHLPHILSFPFKFSLPITAPFPGNSISPLAIRQLPDFLLFHTCSLFSLSLH